MSRKIFAVYDCDGPPTIDRGSYQFDKVRGGGMPVVQHEPDSTAAVAKDRRRHRQLDLAALWVRRRLTLAVPRRRVGSCCPFGRVRH
jgi:hypothetical protein